MRHICEQLGPNDRLLRKALLARGETAANMGYVVGKSAAKTAAKPSKPKAKPASKPKAKAKPTAGGTPSRLKAKPTPTAWLPTRAAECDPTLRRLLAMPPPEATVDGSFAGGGAGEGPKRGGKARKRPPPVPDLRLCPKVPALAANPSKQFPLMVASALTMGVGAATQAALRAGGR